MLEIEVYAAGVRNVDKILALDHELEAVGACVTRSIAITTLFISISTSRR